MALLLESFQTELATLVHDTITKTFDRKLLHLIEILSTELKVDKEHVTKLVRAEFQELKIPRKSPRQKVDNTSSDVPCTSILKSGDRADQQCGRPSENGTCKMHSRPPRHVDHDESSGDEAKTCKVLVKTGVHKGTVCGKPCTKGEFCGRHAKSAQNELPPPQMELPQAEPPQMELPQMEPQVEPAQSEQSATESEGGQSKRRKHHRKPKVVTDEVEVTEEH